MPRTRSTVLSSQTMQSTVEQLYASFALPLPGETCRGQLAEVMPQFVAQLPELEFESSTVRSEEPMLWDPSNYVLHSAPEPTGLGSYSPDENRDLRVRATYRRNPEVTKGDEYVEVTCAFSVLFVDDGMRIEVLCELRPLQCLKLKPPAMTSLSSRGFKYSLESCLPLLAKHELRLTTLEVPKEISRRMTAARTARVRKINDLESAHREHLLTAFQALQEKRHFQPYEFIRKYGEETISALTRGSYSFSYWAHFGHNGEHGKKAERYVTILRDDGRGGLLQVDRFEIASLFREETDRQLSSRLLRTQR